MANSSSKLMWVAVIVVLLIVAITMAQGNKLCQINALGMQATFVCQQKPPNPPPLKINPQVFKNLP